MSTSPPDLSRAAEFLSLHRPGEPLLMPNPWDLGSARLLAALGFEALATTSGGFALTLGRPDGQVSRDEALAHAAAIAGAVEVPVNADLEDAFARDPAEVAETMALVPATGVAGASIEDWHDGAILPLELAAERVRAAKEALGDQVVLTGRAENFLRGSTDLGDTIARLTAYAEAGADVLYAPLVTDPDDLRAILSSIDRPLNVLLVGDVTVPMLADLGVARVSVGTVFSSAAYGSLVAAAEHLRGTSAGDAEGPVDFPALVGQGRDLIQRALG